jgi:predicted DNA-binding mobile mystery protein A
MKNLKKKLLIEQLDRKLAKLAVLDETGIPAKGWVNTIRIALNMSLSQLGKRLKITAQSVREIEQREMNKTVSLKVLVETAEALNMKFVYGFIPNDTSIEKMVERRAFEIARDIVLRTSHSMSLEDQGNSEERISKAIKDRAEIIKQELPKYLWN